MCNQPEPRNVELNHHWQINSQMEELINEQYFPDRLVK